MTGSMRWLRVAVPAGALAAWLVASFAQQQTPPPAPRPPAENAEAERPSPPTPPAAEEDDDDTFTPTEELAPDAAVTFPVDI